MPLTRRPAFWIAYAGLAAVALAVAWKLFPLAIPLVNLDVTLARHEAIERATAVASRLHLAPANARTAVRFAQDRSTQNYVELEGGGKETFAALVAGNVYAPYWWEVRLFAPGEITEAKVRFRPDGAPYGFVERLPETWMPTDPAGLALDAATARRVAEERAQADWNVDLRPFRLLEATQETRTNGRVDHVFVYERTEGNLGESKFRLRLGVTGNQLTEVTRSVHIPESFERRFQELRSANNTIAAAASLAAGVLYGLGGCLLGVTWLLRARQLQWRSALVAGFVVGGLMGAMTLANLPAAWFGYDTAQSVTTFLLRQFGAAVFVAFGGGLGYALVFMAAEGLARRAFPAHPQLWRLWSREAAPTRQVLGRTLGGYLFVPIELGMIAAFYYASNRWLGWWQPSEALTDPNILGSAVPALAPIAISLQAGFMEECLFRAVPLALAAIVGERLGRRGLAIGAAVVVQAMIFGGAHANYPGFPAYSRLVELILPSVLWALIFLRYGLLPTILLHALFDLALFSIPVFLVDAPGSALQRGLIVAAALVPMVVVLWRRRRASAWGELPDALRNRGWRPPAPPAPVHVPAVPASPVEGWARAFQRALPVLAIAGAAGWLVATPFRADAPGLPLDRAQALAAADNALRERGVTLGPAWRQFATIRLASDNGAQWLSHRFVWREAGPAAYARLIGNTLAPPLWEVRYATFEGDVADRAEEWRVTVDGDGTVRQVRHVLPEARPGARLDREAAQERATRAVVERFGIDAGALRLVAAEDRRLDARTDWTFTFADPRIDVGTGGEARFGITLAGDEVAGIGRFVHVPEAWMRSERERAGREGIVRMSLVVVFALAGLAALVFAVVQWTRGHCERRTLVVVAGLTLGVAIATFANGWPQLAIGLATTEPVTAQVALAAGSALAGGLVTALLVGLVAGVGTRAAAVQRPASFATPLPAWGIGVAAALFAAGIGAVFARLVPSRSPRWPSFPVEATALPWVGALLQGAHAIIAVFAALFVLFCVERLTGAWQRRVTAAVAAVVVANMVPALVGAADPVAAAIEGAVIGLATAAIVFGVLRFDYRVVPAYMATITVLALIESGAQRATFAAWLHTALGCAVTIVVAWAVSRHLARLRAGGASTG